MEVLYPLHISRAILVLGTSCKSFLDVGGGSRRNPAAVCDEVSEEGCGVKEPAEGLRWYVGLGVHVHMGGSQGYTRAWQGVEGGTEGTRKGRGREDRA